MLFPFSVLTSLPAALSFSQHIWQPHMPRLGSELPHMSHLGSELLGVLPLGMELLLSVSHPGSGQHSAGIMLVCAVSSPLELAQMCLDEVHLHFCASLHWPCLCFQSFANNPLPISCWPLALTLVVPTGCP